MPGTPDRSSPCVFRDTPQELAEAFLRDEKTVVGMSEDEVVDIERSLTVFSPGLSRIPCGWGSDPATGCRKVIHGRRTTRSARVT